MYSFTFSSHFHSSSPSRSLSFTAFSSMADSLVPPWLEALLTSPFFTICRSHDDSPRSERNMFCLDCPSASAFCFYCRSTSHFGHRTIQIRRSSYHDVVRVSEIQKVLDIGGVQTYVINSARVLFLNERPQPKSSSAHHYSTTSHASSSSISTSLIGSGAHHICETCSRTLLDPYRFCSLGCKLEGIRRNGNACFVVDQLAQDGEGEGEEEGEEEKVERGGGKEKARRRRATLDPSGGVELKTKRWRRRGGRAIVRNGGGGSGSGSGSGGGVVGGEVLRESGGHGMCSAPTLSTSQTIATTSSNTNRRRKGVPHRSPLTSS